jgi:hypothetical protein
MRYRQSVARLPTFEKLATFNRQSVLVSGATSYYIRYSFMVYNRWDYEEIGDCSDAYQICILSFSGKYIESPGCTLKAE